jgi:siroheme synthase
VNPTPRSEWAEVGDTVVATLDERAMRGVVLNVVDKKMQSIPYAVVKWASGATGRHTITTLRKVPNKE